MAATHWSLFLPPEGLRRQSHQRANPNLLDKRILAQQLLSHGNAEPDFPARAIHASNYGRKHRTVCSTGSYTRTVTQVPFQ